MKNIVAFLLLFFFALNPLAFYIMLEMHKLRVTAELEKNNEKGKITVLTIPDPDTACSFHWNNAHEISYQGRYYDVVKQERKNGNILLYCIHDKNEEAILSFMKKLTGHKYFTFSLDDIVKITPSGDYPDHIIPFSDFHFPMLTDKMESITPDALSPPPKQS
jgi:hypothetical protein